MKRLPVICPCCQTNLVVKRLRCDECQTEVEGLYPLPILSLLSREDQEFVIAFVNASGSLKEMAVRMSVSYPTIRNRLDDVIKKLRQISSHQENS